MCVIVWCSHKTKKFVGFLSLPLPSCTELGANKTITNHSNDVVTNILTLFIILCVLTQKWIPPNDWQILWIIYDKEFKHLFIMRVDGILLSSPSQIIRISLLTPSTHRPFVFSISIIIKHKRTQKWEAHYLLIWNQFAVWFDNRFNANDFSWWITFYSQCFCLILFPQAATNGKVTLKK